MSTPEVDTSTAAQPSSPTSIKRFRLQVVEGHDAGRGFTSSEARTTIGTQEGNDVQLHDPTVSRFHAELVLHEGGVLLRDLSSRNGTFVQGVRVQSACVGSGNLIALGTTTLRFELEPHTISLPIYPKARFGKLRGQSIPMRLTFARLERAAQSEATVLLSGETGTGKELAAQSIHDESARASGPFVVVDCSAVPANLLESELFGHEKGAFTGATSAREGMFEAARGGTLFLDEVGEMPLELQPKLLRVLERRETRRLGSSKSHPLDVRIIAATNRDLREEVNQKRFRPDLYFRLAVLSIELPPLRDRLDDMGMLVDGIAEALGRVDARERLLDPSFIDELRGHRWPGNVRELRNYVERYLAFGERMTSTAPASTQPFPVVDASKPLRDERERFVAHFERVYLDQLLERHGGNVSAAARAAGLDRAYVYRLLWRYGLR